MSKVFFLFRNSACGIGHSGNALCSVTVQTGVWQISTLENASSAADLRQVNGRKGTQFIVTYAMLISRRCTVLLVELYKLTFPLLDPEVHGLTATTAVYFDVYNI
jgi:hypothetical protein